ncbi:MAG: 5-formyltetrahydrofolate cyclo-ligase [Bacteroidetes bacterium]|nr:5-formyltetrahydrofolate cyclo-ligase [Bacteroidota bacterium]
MTKKDLRAFFQARRLALEPQTYFRFSSLITEHLIRDYCLPGKKVHLFIGSQNRREVNTLPLLVHLLRQNKEVWAPVITPEKKMLHGEIKTPEDLVEGPFGLIQPQNGIEKILPDVVIVPGLAFTDSGIRLGWGKGYYDSFLAQLPSTVQKVGVCFQFQIAGELPADSWDIQMDFLVTEKGSIRCRKSV